MNERRFLCPFFEGSSITNKRVSKGTEYIECESPCVRAEKLLVSKPDLYKLYNVFNSKGKAQYHAEKFCCTMDYTECRTYKMIAAYKYKD